MGWYSASWKYRIKLTVDHTKVNSSLSSFPIFVDLANFPATFFSNVKSDGGDIRITSSDGVTELPREVVSIDTTAKTGELHFKAGSLSSSTDTIFYLYYGNSSASEPTANAIYGKYNVWDSNYVAVYHMNNLDSTHLGDSTSNQITLTKGSVALTEATGKLGKAQSNPGSNWASASSSLFNALTGAVTLEGWVNYNVNNTNQDLVNKDSDKLRLIRNAGGGYLPQITAGANNGLNAGTPTVGTWYHIAGTYDLSNLYAYRNGVAGSAQANTATTALGTANMYFGAKDATANYMNGLMDEVRVSKIARSAAWLLTQFNNQNSPSTFFTISGQEVNGNSALFFSHI